MGTPKAPRPPDPRQTAAAQTGTNIGTAIANNAIGMMDQYTPEGSLTYSLRGGGNVPSITESQIQREASAPQRVWQTTGGEGTGRYVDVPGTGGGGTATQYTVGDQTFSDRAQAEQYQNTLRSQSGSYVDYTDPYTGETYQIPQYESRVELSPELQAQYDLNTQAQTNLAGTAADQSAFLREYLGEPAQFDTEAIEGRLTELGRQRIDPRFERREADMRTRLANQGIAPGSEAYNREMDMMGQDRNDAYNNLYLQGRGQAFQELGAMRNQPINEITALLSGSQVSQPNVRPMQPQGAATTDVAGIIGNDYNTRLSNFRNEQQQRQGLYGGLFDAGATMLGAPGTSILGKLFS